MSACEQRGSRGLLGALGVGLAATLAAAGLLLTSATAQHGRGAVTHASTREVPAALVRAIHARFGAGPVALGHAPLVAGIEPAAGGWQVKVRGQQLGARIAANGAVSAHIDDSASASLTPLDLAEGGEVVPLSATNASVENGRLLMALGPATSTDQLTMAGLEQRFTVSRPLAAGARQLTLAFSSATNWRTIRDGTAIVPTGDRDGQLSYAGLRATDARGRVLRSRFVLTDRGAEIVTDTEHAVYPVTIDPTWTSTSTPTATLALGADDGEAVALSADGTTALVGASGAGYVYHESAEGSWSSSSAPAAVLTDGASSADTDSDGASVALSSDGTTALIGVPGANNGAGAVYVFNVSSQSAWASSSTPTAVLNTSTGGLFGYSVAISSDGTTALIGAINPNNAAGAAYIFQASSESSWTSTSTPTATLTNSSGSAGDEIGWSVALSSDGTTALVGAVGVSSDTGAAYVFQASSEDTWSTSDSPVTLTNGSGNQGDELGSSVALSTDGTTALIGAEGANSDEGAAYVFNVSSETSWATNATPKATLSEASGGSGDDFGAAVSLSSDGTTALIGANAYDGTGAAYVFQAGSETSWASSDSPKATLTNGSGSQGDGLGSSVALSSDGTTALTGATGVNGGVGAAYVFHATSETSWSDSDAPAATLTAPSTTGEGGYGYAVALSSDGTTALVAAKGAAYIFQTSSSWASSSVATARLVGASGSTAFASVALSADGTTALIGESDADGGAGAAYVFHVSSEDSWASSSAPTATLTNSKGSSTDELGTSVALSADGQLALVGAPGVNGGAGAAYVFYVSSESSWTSNATPAATLTDSSGAANDALGRAVAVSSDGTTALISAPGAPAAYVFQASAEDAWASHQTPTATLTNSASSSFASSLALSGDGTTALIGDQSADYSKGAAYIYHVSSESSWATGSSSTPTATLTDSTDFLDELGSGVALSSDGTIALVGADGTSNNGGTSGTGTGAAFVFQVSSADSWASSSAPSAALTDGAGGYGDLLGSSVALTLDGTTALAGGYTANDGVGGAYVFAIPSNAYKLTVDASGSGTGTVTSTDGAINCGSTCSSSYAGGSSVTLSAQAGTDSTFTGWSVTGASDADCQGTGACVVTIDADTTVTANFDDTGPPKLPLTVFDEGNGSGSVTSSPTGLSCPSTCTADFDFQSSVTLTATPTAGGTFIGWHGEGCSGTGTCEVTMSSDQTVDAIFAAAPAPQQDELFVSLAGSGAGSVSSSPGGITCGDVCAAPYDQGTAVTLTPTPASGSTFAGWSGGGCSGTGSCTVTTNAAQTVTATFTTPAPQTAPPSCALTPQGARVYVAAKHSKPPKKHPPFDTLDVSVRCDQPATAQLRGTISTVSHGKFKIGAVKGTVKPDATLRLAVKLPKSAIAALQKGDKESAVFTLTATNANGVDTATAKVAKLKLVKLS